MLLRNYVGKMKIMVYNETQRWYLRYVNCRMQRRSEEMLKVLEV